MDRSRYRSPQSASRRWLDLELRIRSLRAYRSERACLVRRNANSIRGDRSPPASAGQSPAGKSLSQSGTASRNAASYLAVSDERQLSRAGAVWPTETHKRNAMNLSSRWASFESHSRIWGTPSRLFLLARSQSSGNVSVNHQLLLRSVLKERYASQSASFSCPNSCHFDSALRDCLFSGWNLQRDEPRSGSKPEWFCALPVHQLVEHRHFQRAGRSKLGELHQLHRVHSYASSRLRSRRLSQSDHRYSVSDCGGNPA